MCPGAHSLGPPGGLCVSGSYKNCPPIRNGIAGRRWKSALHKMPLRIISEVYRQNRPYRAYKAFLVANCRSQQQLQLGDSHSPQQIHTPIIMSTTTHKSTVTVGSNFLPQSLRSHSWRQYLISQTYSEKAEASRDGRKLRRATQSSGVSFPRPCPKLQLSHRSTNNHLNSECKSMVRPKTNIIICCTTIYCRMCPGAHSLGPPGVRCVSRSYNNCPPIRNGIPGRRWKSALHKMPCRIVSERHQQNRPYRAF
jgi:hypothetical protein